MGVYSQQPRGAAGRQDRSAYHLARVALTREREYAIHDTSLQGFTLRVQPNDTRSRVFRFRRDSKPRRVTLGKPGPVKADQAAGCRPRLPHAREGRRESGAASRFRPDADQIRRRPARRTATSTSMTRHSAKLRSAWYLPLQTSDSIWIKGLIPLRYLRVRRQGVLAHRIHLTG